MSLPSGPVPPSPCRYYGLTKVQAIEQGYDAEEGVASYDACLRGRVFAPDGMLKLVFDKESKRLLGVHIIGTDACEVPARRHSVPPPGATLATHHCPLALTTARSPPPHAPAACG